jgi:hypothetical protein
VLHDREHVGQCHRVVDDLAAPADLAGVVDVRRRIEREERVEQGREAVELRRVQGLPVLDVADALERAGGRRRRRRGRGLRRRARRGVAGLAVGFTVGAGVGLGSGVGSGDSSSGHLSQASRQAFLAFVFLPSRTPFLRQRFCGFLDTQSQSFRSFLKYQASLSSHVALGGVGRGVGRGVGFGVGRGVGFRVGAGVVAGSSPSSQADEQKAA